MVAKLFFGRVEKRPSRKGEFVEDSIEEIPKLFKKLKNYFFTVKTTP